MPAREVRRRPIAHHVIDEHERLSLAHVHTDYDRRFSRNFETEIFICSKAHACPETVAFVGSDKASFVTGPSFSVDGGHTTG
jgi:hypothetical protein